MMKRKNYTSDFRMNACVVTVACMLFYTVCLAQAINRQDRIFIQKGIQFQSWIRVDHASESVQAPTITVINIRNTGRYIRIQLSATDPLSLAEVEVFSGGVNVALNKLTQQSSNINSTNGFSNLAVDGNTDGNYVNGSVTHTLNGYAAIEPWWQVDIGSPVSIDSIRIWNRTDCCGQRLKGFYLFVSNNPYSVNTLSGTLAQSGVTRYVQPGVDSFPHGAELSNIGFAPTYYERPQFNYTIYQQNPNMQWGLAKSPDATQLARGPSTFEQSNGFLNSLQYSNVNNLSSICFGDEENYSSSNTTNLTNWYNIARAKYPNVLLHSNQYLNQWTTAQLQTYMQSAQPDLLTFDKYYFYLGGSPGPGNSQMVMFQDMQNYRQLALGGYDGTSSSPIAFGGYLQGYNGSRNGGTNNYFPSESEFNIGVFSYLTMGVKWMNVFRYISHPGSDNAYFYKDDAGRLLPQYWQYANLGKQVTNLSPHLCRLRSTDLRFIPGQNTNGTNPSPNNIAAWNSTADPYITNMTATNLVNTTNSGLAGDILVGYFKPVPGMDTAAGITMSPVPNVNTKYFMVLNGLNVSNGCCDPLGSAQLSQDTIQGKANQATQKIVFTINFGSNPVDTLYRVRRADGVVEMVNLTLVSGSQYTVSDTLDGGLADLFYWKNAGNPGSGTTNHNAVSLSSGSISAGNVTQLTGAAQSTIEAWVKFNSVGNWSTVFGEQTDVYNRIILQTYSDGSLYVNVSNGNNSYGHTAANTLTSGQWYHLAVVYDGTQATNAARLKFFVNGNQVSLRFNGTIPSTTSSTNAAPLLFGNACTSCTGNYLNGVIDEIRVWNAALSSATILGWKDKLLGTCHPNYANLVIYWPLDSAGNNTVAVAGLSTGYTGTITNGTYVASTQATAGSGCPGGSGNPIASPTELINSAAGSVKVYPNPVSYGVLNIELSSSKAGNTSIRVFDLMGRELYRNARHFEKGFNKVTVDVSGFEKGSYILMIKEGNGSRQFKFNKL